MLFFLRGVVASRYPDGFFDALRHELPFYVHEYAWWNLVDIGDAYLYLRVEDQEMRQRIGNEVGKLMMVMQDDYCARAFRQLAFFGVGNLSTLKTLLRYSAKGIHKMAPQLTAEVVVACAVLGLDPTSKLRRRKRATTGGMMLRRYLYWLTPRLSAVPPDHVAAVVHALRRMAFTAPRQFFWHVDRCARGIHDAETSRLRPFPAAEQLSVLRDFFEVCSRQ